jgi:serine/threonine protein kinase
MQELCEAGDILLSLDVQRTVDEVCDAFEARLRRGEEPRIEDALAACSEECRPHLFRELLKIEREYRQKRADENYHRRFPEYATVLGVPVVPVLNRSTSESSNPTMPYSDIGHNPEIPFPQIPGYEIRSELGRGAMGVVYKARHLKLKCFVALKMMLAGPFAQPEGRLRFRFEAEAIAALDHPGIVRIYEVGEFQGQPFFAMQLVEGSTLTQRLGDFRSDLGKAAGVLADVARAVQHAHDRGLLHRDIKPGNILLDTEAQPHVADFGLAKRIGSDGDLTQSGGIAGTLNYMAPEQARGERGVTVTADVYALGAILYELLTGETPVKGATNMETLTLLLEGSVIARPRLRNRAAPIDLEAICLKCLERDPANRYPSAAALADDLDRFLNNEPVSVQPPGVWDWLVQSMRTRPQPYPDYTFTAPFWVAGLVFAQHMAIFALVETSQPMWLLWMVMLSGWLGMGLALWFLLLRRFRELPITERHSMMVSIGNIAAQVVLFLAVVPLSLHGSCREILPLYPPLIVVSGLCFVILGSTNWGRLFPIGLVMMSLALVMSAWPETGPLLFATVVPLALIFWALAKWWYFVRVRKTTDTTQSRVQ